MANEIFKKLDIRHARETIGMPKDAGAFMRFALLMASTLFVTTRHKIGARIVSVPRIAAMALLLFVYGGITSLISASYYHVNVEQFLFFAWLPVISVTAWASIHRFIRWYGLHFKGELLNTRSLGHSWTFFFVPRPLAERYVEPAWFLAWGIYLCTEPQPGFWATGLWNCLAALCLFTVEKWTHEKMFVDKHDDMLAAQGHERAAAGLEAAIRAGSEAAIPKIAPLATGLDDDLLALIRHREATQPSGPSLPHAIYPQAPGPLPAAQVPPVTAKAAPALGFASAEEPFYRADWAAANEPSAGPPRPYPTPASVGSRAPSELPDRSPVVLLAVVLGLIAVALFLSRSPSPKPPTAEAPVALAADRLPAASQAEWSPPQLNLATPKPAPLAPAVPAALSPARAAKLGEDSYYGSNGQAKDLPAAARYYQLAAEGGHPGAQLSLGQMYEAGEGGLPKDEAMAVQWYAKAALQGYAPAQTFLGDMLAWGKGVTADDATAVALYKAAARQGDARGQFALAGMFREGRGGLARDDAAAAGWYRKSAGQGFALAQTMLGLMYAAGKGGLAQNSGEARKWLTAAAAQGEETAKSALEKMR